jgi:hypothetical protein
MITRPVMALGLNQFVTTTNSAVLTCGYNAVPPTLFAPLDEICGEISKIDIIKTLFYARLAAV